MNDANGRTVGLQQACHDIRQPIAGVLALAGAALTETGLPENVRARLNQIVGLAEWQSDVVEHWLGESGDAPAPAPPADIVWVVNQAVATERLTWAGELTLRWPPEPVYVWLPEVSLRLAAANLLANATRAAGPSGTVAIQVKRRAGWMALVVEDSGPGFGRLPRRSGRGLSAVAREVAGYDGRLECGRGRLGGGRVSLWLPAAPVRRGRKVTGAARVV